LETDMEIEDEFVRRTKEEVEKAVTKELCDPVSAKTILSEVDQLSTEAACEERKTAIVKVLLISTWTQRLYFVIRSVMMTLISAAISLVVIWYYVTMNFTQLFILGIFLFVVSLAISRLFDSMIVRISKRIVRYLSKHKRLRKFILKNF